ncbi:MAG TPA: sensor histidine kinase [Gemmatimonadaceae bacterium]|nr:sensor histidine kinase [Gemmatimonadaceae bacterium]
MRLADFISMNREPILVEWERYASTLGSVGGAMDLAALRDHADEMLTVIEKDLRTPQSDAQQSAKSKGNEPEDGGDTTAAESHGAGRAASGFTVEQMVSEFRALRATVIRLWTDEVGKLSNDELEDLTRFNEAIDQSLAESVTRYTEQLTTSKDAFIAILAHDLRTPLATVSASAKNMMASSELTEGHVSTAKQIATSTARMSQLVGDLLNFTQTNLGGGGIPVERSSLAMDKVVQDVVDGLALIHPGRTIKVVAQGDMRGEWDCHRISQGLSNVIGNALEHGSDWTIVRVNITGEAREVRIAIQNSGAAIPQAQLKGIFTLMKPKTSGKVDAEKIAERGIGLYIANRVVTAHKGTIAVESSDSRGTTFTIRLPRHEAKE